MGNKNTGHETVKTTFCRICEAQCGLNVTKNSKK